MKFLLFLVFSPGYYYGQKVEIAEFNTYEACSIGQQLAKKNMKKLKIAYCTPKGEGTPIRTASVNF